MRGRVERVLSDADSSASEVFVDGFKICYGLEDEPRDVKVNGKTRIPAGIYPVGVHTAGSFHNRYSNNTFADIHKGMLHIQNIPNFEWVLIHCGVTHKNTAGCLLLGDDVITTHGSMRLVDSPSAYRRFYELVIDAALAGDLTIEFIDKDLDEVSR
ncbi:MAG: hypothetical protein KKF24_11295 [Gammaproteobacteria bacterium]|nr:hypothetical protein [Gammaproteobacteria bacterium]MBU1833269.1 hypothetical protein [Gammaproteobacteria bacterium]